MADIVSTEKRSQMMAAIKGKNTKPELVIRSALHGKGFRFRIHEKKLPGNPDIVLKKYNAVIFVHGCFWHGHTCHLFKWPGSRREFWENKINRNKTVDTIAIGKLKNEGWRICIIWECAIKGKKRLDFGALIDLCTEWLYSDNDYLEIIGQI